jgi:hypothetical protein
MNKRPTARKDAAQDNEAKSQKSEKLKTGRSVTHASATFFIPRDDWRRLKKLAVEHDSSLQGILEEAVSAWLVSKGEKPLSEPDAS